MSEEMFGDTGIPMRFLGFFECHCTGACRQPDGTYGSCPLVGKPSDFTAEGWAEIAGREVRAEDYATEALHSDYNEWLSTWEHRK